MDIIWQAPFHSVLNCTNARFLLSITCFLKLLLLIIIFFIFISDRYIANRRARFFLRFQMLAETLYCGWFNNFTANDKMENLFLNPSQYFGKVPIDWE